MATFYEESPVIDPDQIAVEITNAADQTAFDTFFGTANGHSECRS